MMKRQRFKLSDYHDEILMASMIALGVGAMALDKQLPRYYNNINNNSNASNNGTVVEAVIVAENSETSEITLPEDEPKAVRFTSYYIGDCSGSGASTSSGLSVDDFEINEMGWYTYQGKVVLATATHQCLEAFTGACGKYDKLPDGYNIHQLYDELTIFLGGNNYEAIVLDSCGASFWEEELQRYDIFVKDKASVYDGSGYVLSLNED